MASAVRDLLVLFNKESLQKKFVDYSPHFNDEELTSIEKVESFRELHKLFNTLLLKYEKVATDDKKSDKRKGAAKGRRGDRGKISSASFIFYCYLSGGQYGRPGKPRWKVVLGLS